MSSADPAGADARYLSVRRVSRRFGETTVLDDLSLDVSRGEFVSLLGPSGCGKTTLLRLVAGLLLPDRGTIAVDGRDLTGLPAHRRNVGVVFQNYALFPHLTVAENVAFGLRARRLPRAGIADAVRRALALVRMEALADRRIGALSGGQQQRIAVARAIVVQPALLLLDEPFSALDRKLRETMQIELRALLRELAVTAVFVTHDQDEALTMSDRIAVMQSGRIEQLAGPTALYDAPASLYVLDFIGKSCVLAGEVVDGGPGTVAVATALGIVRAPGRYLRGARVVVGVRPEAIAIGGEPGSEDNAITAEVQDRIFVAGRTTLHFRTAGADRILVETGRIDEALGRPGARVGLRFPVDRTLVFPAP